MSEERTYLGLLYKDADSDFGISFPDFPGCVAAGETSRQAYEEARAALEFHIAGLLEDGEQLPQPREIEDLAGETDFARIDDDALNNAGEESQQGQPLPVYITVTIPGNTIVRFNISASALDINIIDHAAERIGKSRSRFMLDSALERAKSEHREYSKV